MNQLDTLSEALQATRSLPPVDTWHPDVTDAIDIRIAADGDWFHEGTRIERQRMVRLFASVLRKDDDGETYLVTPQVKLRIAVDDAPFLAVALDRQGSGKQTALTFTTNMGDVVVVDAGHPLRVSYRASDAAPDPYVRVRHHLEARLTRSVFLQLADQAIEQDGQYGVWSSGDFIVLGDASGGAPVSAGATGGMTGR